MRKTKQIVKVFQPPSQLVWTDEKLASLSKEQLLNLFDNLQTQRESGRVMPQAADELERLITARLPASARKKLRGAVEAQQQEESQVEDEAEASSQD
jgi:hypothetical protein